MSYFRKSTPVRLQALSRAAYRSLRYLDSRSFSMTIVSLGQLQLPPRQFHISLVQLVVEHAHTMSPALLASVALSMHTLQFSHDVCDAHLLKLFLRRGRVEGISLTAFIEMLDAVSRMRPEASWGFLFGMHKHLRVSVAHSSAKQSDVSRVVGANASSQQTPAVRDQWRSRCGLHLRSLLPSSFHPTTYESGGATSSSSARENMISVVSRMLHFLATMISQLRAVFGDEYVVPEHVSRLWVDGLQWLVFSSCDDLESLTKFLSRIPAAYLHAAAQESYNAVVRAALEQSPFPKSQQPPGVRNSNAARSALVDQLLRRWKLQTFLMQNSTTLSPEARDDVVVTPRGERTSLEAALVSSSTSAAQKKDFLRSDCYEATLQVNSVLQRAEVDRIPLFALVTFSPAFFWPSTDRLVTLARASGKHDSTSLASRESLLRGDELLQIVRLLECSISYLPMNTTHTGKESDEDRYDDHTARLWVDWICCVLEQVEARCGETSIDSYSIPPLLEPLGKTLRTLEALPLECRMLGLVRNVIHALLPLAIRRNFSGFIASCNVLVFAQLAQTVPQHIPQIATLVTCNAAFLSFGSVLQLLPVLSRVPSLAQRTIPHILSLYEQQITRELQVAGVDDALTIIHAVAHAPQSSTALVIAVLHYIIAHTPSVEALQVEALQPGKKRGTHRISLGLTVPLTAKPLEASLDVSSRYSKRFYFQTALDFWVVSHCLESLQRSRGTNHNMLELGIAMEKIESVSTFANFSSSLQKESE